MRTIHRLVLPIIILCMTLGVLAPVVVEAGKGYYVLDQTIRSGMLVSLTKNPEVVEATNDKNMPTLVGVVGTSQTDYDVASKQISVQTDGVVDTLVSTVTGDIRVGDHIAPSSIVGFGAKSGNSGWTVGIAQGSLDSHTKGAVKSVVTDSSGAKHEVYVANIPVEINVTYFNPQEQTEQKTTPVPSRVQAIADSLAGRQASQVAVILSFLLLLAGFVIAGIIVNAAVRSGISSTARQPLARQAIAGRMLQSFAMALGILAGTAVGSLILIHIL